MEWNYFIVDIGAGIMSFAQMMSGAAEIMELKRFIIPVPLFSPKISSCWLILFTPVPLKIASAFRRWILATVGYFNKKRILKLKKQILTLFNTFL